MSGLGGYGQADGGRKHFDTGNQNSFGDHLYNCGALETPRTASRDAGRSKRKKFQCPIW